jgi:hypothetical protein
MSPRVTDNAITQSANPILAKAGLQFAREMDSHPRPVSLAMPQEPSSKRSLLERRRNRWSRRQW